MAAALCCRSVENHLSDSEQIQRDLGGRPPQAPPTSRNDKVFRLQRTVAGGSLNSVV